MSYQFQDEDIISPDFYGTNGHPFEAFAWLRKNDPVHWTRTEAFSPFWAITKHKDIIEIERQPEIFTNEPRPFLYREASTPEIGQDIKLQIFQKLKDSPKLMELMKQSNGQALIRSLVRMDPPDHPKYRELLQPWFKPANLKQLEERLRDDHWWVRRGAAEALGRMAADGSVPLLVERLRDEDRRVRRMASVALAQIGR